METEEKRMQEEVFSYDGYQVVRGEFFAHTFEPSITFCDSKVYVNMACLNRMPDVEYIQILINQQTKSWWCGPAGRTKRILSDGAAVPAGAGPDRSPAGSFMRSWRR